MIFLNSAGSAAALVFYLPGVFTHTDTKAKQRKAGVRNILKPSQKKTIFNEHPVVGCRISMYKKKKRPSFSLTPFNTRVSHKLKWLTHQHVSFTSVFDCWRGWLGCSVKTGIMFWSLLKDKLFNILPRSTRQQPICQSPSSFSCPSSCTHTHTHTQCTHKHKHRFEHIRSYFLSFHNQSFSSHSSRLLLDMSHNS